MRGLLWILPVCILIAGPAGARTWAVALDGTGDFQNIQDAIVVAGHDDVIEINPGVYHGALDTQGKVLDLIGIGGPEVTIVDADRQGAALTIAFSPGGTPVIRGLTFRDGIGKLLRDGTRDGRFGGGVFVEMAFVEFEDCVFADNSANNGGGIYVRSGAPRFIRCVVSGNAAGVGGGVALEHDGGVRLKECSIVDNQAVFGGGLCLFHSLLQMDGCKVRENFAAEGGAVRLLERGPGVVWIRDSILAENSADRGAALQVLSADLWVVQTTIARNSPPGSPDIELVDAGVWLTSTVAETTSEGDLISCQGAPAQLECVVLWSPSGEPVDCIDGERFLFADPLFCDPDEGDYLLQPQSPCLPGQGPDGCDRIGAMRRGCLMPAMRVETDWGGLKNIFR